MKITEEIFNALAPEDLGKSMPSEMPLPPCDPILRTLPSSCQYPASPEDCTRSCEIHLEKHAHCLRLHDMTLRRNFLTEPDPTLAALLPHYAVVSVFSKKRRPSREMW